jgi:hypothetical protein
LKSSLTTYLLARSGVKLVLKYIKNKQNKNKNKVSCRSFIANYKGAGKTAAAEKSNNARRVATLKDFMGKNV